MDKVVQTECFSVNLPEDANVDPGGFVLFFRGGSFIDKFGQR